MGFLITFRTPVVSVEKKRRALRARKIGTKDAEGKDEIVVEYEDLGWFVHLHGSWESLFIGHDEPDLKPGQVMVVTMRAETYNEGGNP